MKKPLEVYHRSRHEGIGLSLLLMETQKDSKVILPQSFNVGQVSVEINKIMHAYTQMNKKDLFYCTLKPGDTIEYSFNSSNSIWFTVALCDEPTWNLKTEEMVLDEQNIITYMATYTADHDIVVCFRFKTEPPMTSKITFKGAIRKYAFN